MRLYKQLLTNNNCHKAGKSLVVKGVMWHSTGANNPNLRRYVQPDDGILGLNSNSNHWNTSLPGGRQVCVHAFIGLDKNGEVATYQTLPWDMKGWHAGGTANDTHIGFEICEDALVDAEYFNKVYKEACELTAYLCKMYSLDPMADGVVICHSEGYTRGIASNHSDVMHWFKKYGKTMDDVRKDVAAKLSGEAVSPEPTGTPDKEDVKMPKCPYLVRVSIDDLCIRNGPGVTYTWTGKYTGKGVFTITEVAGNWGRLKSGAGWISLAYCTEV